MTNVSSNRRDNSRSAANRSRALYEYGATTVFSHGPDPRFVYSLYVPKSLLTTPGNTELIVVVHGSNRTFEAYRDRFSEFAKWNDCVVLCPLFPVGVLGDRNGDGYKQLQEGDIRYDQVVIDMVSEVGARYGQKWDKFALFGFSGGGQFANRFCLLHPELLWAVSIGAPGSVTLLDTDKNWWTGCKDMAQRFGKSLNLEALRSVPVQMVVGKADVETWEITHKPGGKHYVEGANDAGSTRLERLRTLADSFESAGVSVEVCEVENVAHEASKVMPSVQDFFATVLRKRRSD